jgi:CheY-like chemotaxis protein
MPRMHGYDVARALRAQPAGRAARIIAITGADTESRETAQSAGCDELLHKPASLIEIVATLGRRHAPAAEPPPLPER